MSEPNEQPASPRGRGRPELPDDKKANALIVLRVKRRQKSAYVRAANVKGETLSAWSLRALDKESGYSE